MSFSVLLSLYDKEKPEFLRTSLESVFNQTKLPEEVILILDGKITLNLKEVINDFTRVHDNLKVIPLETNQGLGVALNKGLEYCSYDLVIRMDTDDICKPYRFAKLVEFMNNHPEIDACSSWIEEFHDRLDNILSLRKLPEKSEELRNFAKSRNPLNHPAAIFRKSAVLKAGGYIHMPLFEDYFLWARMLMNGCNLYNIQESLLYFRVSPDMFQRRGGIGYLRKEIEFQKALKKIGFINSSQYIKNILIRTGVRIIPNSFRGWVYKNIIHQ